MTEALKAPFPWFGGKRKVSPQVWTAMGDVHNYVEPFAGSLAVLLGRPASHRGKTETVNDKDRFVANFWRALALDPEGVARHADWPVNEADLFARHMWLVQHGATLIERIEADPDYHDSKVAGWWVWGICSWIGSGWCSGKGPWVSVDGAPVEAAGGVNRQLPHLGNMGQGVNRQLPHLGDAGRGVNRQLPHLGDAGQGVSRKRPHLGDAGRGVNRQLPHLGIGGTLAGRDGNAVLDYMRTLSDRLRRVRVCCGDWQRVVTRGAMAHGDSVGVFLDPPYQGEVRQEDLYSTDDHGISHAVREWALEHGDDRRMRIVLAGYEAEHEEHMPQSWRRVAWTAGAAYQNHGSDGANKENRRQERLWLSPHCRGRGLL